MLEFVRANYKKGCRGLLEQERKELQGKLDKLMDLLLAEHITPDEHNRKRGQLQNRQIELTELIKKHSEADHSFRDTITSLLTLANRALQLFDEGNFEQKRKLMNSLFSNLSLKGGELQFSLQKPMDQFVNLTTCPEWWAVVDALRTALHQHNHEFSLLSKLL